MMAAVGLLPWGLRADVNGADPRLTGAPGESTCTSCHSGTALNGGPGSVKVVLSGAATYTPGVTQRISVQVSDPNQRRWGFEFTARLVSNLTGGQAGDLASIDSNTRVMCSNGRTKPCATSSPIQFITHTLAGTRSGTTGGVSFDFDWTPPATDQGNVRFYVAANAANNSNTDSGDRIYTTTLELTPAAAAVNKPAISSTRGVVNGASFEGSAAPNTWLTISGTNLAGTTRTWTNAEIAAGNLPTSLDGVSVTINNKAAYVYYISPTQINLIAPNDDARGPVEVKVTANGVTSDAAIVNLGELAPGLFTFDGKYLAATHADNSLLGKSGLFAAAPTLTTPAKPGETIVVYGTGFGGTTPSIAAGKFTDQLAPIAGTVSATMGGTPATLSFAGLVPPFAQVFQFNLRVPEGAADGDQPVVITVNGVASPVTYVTVAR